MYELKDNFLEDKEFKIILPAGSLQKCKTADDLCGLVERKLI